MALKTILVNPYEDKTFRLLLRQAEGEDVYVCPKVSLKDVLPFENAKLSKGLRNFCWTAHFDFVVMTGASEPLHVKATRLHPLSDSALEVQSHDFH